MMHATDSDVRVQFSLSNASFGGQFLLYLLDFLFLYVRDPGAPEGRHTHTCTTTNKKMAKKKSGDAC